MSVSCIHYIGTSAPVHTAPRGTLFWDGVAKKMYVNHDSSTGWTNIREKGIQQMVFSQDAALKSGTGTFPNDDTIPQNTEGNEFMTAMITPANASSTLLIEASAMLATSAAGDIISGLFQDSISSALVAMMNRTGVNEAVQSSLQHVMVAGTTSAITFKFRAGNDSSATTKFNGLAAARKLGGVMNSYIRITEVLP